MKDYSHILGSLRDIRNFPTAGVRFKDIAPVLQDPTMFREVTDGLAEAFRNKSVQKVVGIDARGFLFASPVAYLLNAGVVMARKKGKLPYRTVKRRHSLEYGRGVLEVHTDAIRPGERIVIIDDVLATGGTAHAAVELVGQLGGSIAGLGFFLELSEFSGRERLNPHDIFSLLTI